jgi:membrane protease YdiL (CAAX protease family)
VDASDPIKELFNQYLTFSIGSLFYIGLLKLSHVVANLKSKNQFIFFNLGDKKQYVDILLISLISVIIFYIIAFFIPSYELMYQTTALITESGRKYASFMIFCSVPVEEFIFRGLLIDILLIISNEIFFDFYKVKRNERDSSHPLYPKINNWSWIIAILISSISFALFHIPRYSENIFIMLYLFILALIMGISRRIGGLTTSYSIHLINNLMVLGFLALIYVI